MEPFLRERKLQDPLPSSWRIPRANHKDHHLIKIPKESLHVFDADSGEIMLGRENENELYALATDRNKMRFRLRNCDAPEAEFSVRIYKQGDESATLSAILTRHIGIEALRVARQTLFEASEVLVQVKKDLRGRLFAPKDVYGRRLVNLFLIDSHGAVENFAEKLASLGYTLSFYTTGVDVGIDSAMREAITHKRGIFNLPEELFTYPYRPWDLRKLWKNEEDERRYRESRPILNRPTDPAVWARTETDGLAKAVDDDDNDEDLLNSQDSDNFLFRIVLCKLYWETRCYSAESQIRDAGRGLFIKPHKQPIEPGEHLCLYAEKSTTLQEMDGRKSSRVYAMYVPRKKLWFDSEVETGNNLGRFANQRGVLEAFHEIQRLSETPNPQLTEDDWKKVESYLDEQCNARYDTVGNQLVVKAKRRLEPSKEPTELFVNYGGLREYWIPLTLKHITDRNFPATIKSIVQWLMRSDQCNWTVEQRRIWACAE